MAVVYEDWAASTDEALALGPSLRYIPGHTYGCVAPVTGVVSGSMPLLVVENRTAGTRAYAPLNEGLGRVMRYGACDGEALERLRWLDGTLAPVIRAAIDRNPVDIAAIMAEALHMGDELHNRNKASTCILAGQLALRLVETGVTGDEVVRTLTFLLATDVFFLNLSMAACKAALLATEGTGPASLVSVMSQNGHEFGIQVAGLPGRWFTAPAPRVRGRYLDGFGPADACPAIGDSVITETAGLGAFALAAAPALVRYIGGNTAEAVRLNLAMYDLVAGESRRFTIPALDFRGTPTGIDVRKVCALASTPVTNAGIAHHLAGIGQIGAGYIETPLPAFETAWAALRAGDGVVS